jgi:hypothetical protein
VELGGRGRDVLGRLAEISVELGREEEARRRFSRLGMTWP